ncbi:1409_t:CDS:2 [Diversispora eburnea]|uniref:1409_t:CDS:1 n=1 Tax=Diversispora eburnea TaxID=1213867 RepID=A0A9N8WNU4_9GLOM|nr:1409_t:CDS:2 [Diversispora eburnea]
MLFDSLELDTLLSMDNNLNVNILNNNNNNNQELDVASKIIEPGIEQQIEQYGIQQKDVNNNNNNNQELDKDVNNNNNNYEEDLNKLPFSSSLIEEINVKDNNNDNNINDNSINKQ